MWIRVEDTLPAHRKVKKLARLLKTSQPAAVGHIVSLWLWCAVNASDGDLSGMDEEDIAEAAGWTKKAGAFVEAVRAAGFLDEDWHLHDWEDYAGKMIEAQQKNRKASRERQARYRERQRAKKSDGVVTEETPLGDGKVTPDSALGDGGVTRYVTESDSVGYSPYETKRNDTLLSLSFSSLSDREREFLGAVFFLCQTLKGGALDEAEKGQIAFFWGHMGTAVMERAVDVARKEGKGIPYLLGVLRRKMEQGVTCLEEWDRVEAAGVFREAETPALKVISGLEEEL